MVVDLGLEIFETVHDDLEIVEEKFLVEEVVDLESDCVLEGDLGDFIHLLNIFIAPCIYILVIKSMNYSNYETDGTSIFD
jgi:hypothetical protein